MDRNYKFITFISKYLYLRWFRVANLADIIKIAITFIETTLKPDSKILKELENIL